MTFEALASKEYKEEEAIEAVYHINKVRVLNSETPLTPTPPQTDVIKLKHNLISEEKVL